jgi:hypothetical protein
VFTGSGFGPFGPPRNDTEKGYGRQTAKHLSELKM